MSSLFLAALAGAALGWGLAVATRRPPPEPAPPPPVPPPPRLRVYRTLPAADGRISVGIFGSAGETGFLSTARHRTAEAAVAETERDLPGVALEWGDPPPKRARRR